MRFGVDDVEQRVYGTALQTREPTTANAITEQVDCNPKTARKYLGRFAGLGIVTRHDGQPITCERNDAHFEWRRVNRLAAEHSVETLRQRVQDLTARTPRTRRRTMRPYPATMHRGQPVIAT